MKRHRWQIGFALGLGILSVALFVLHFIIFRDSYFIEINLVDDIAFLPVQVLLVTFVVNGLMTFREKRAMLYKLNMVIGVFFSEVGTPLIALCRTLEPGKGDQHRDLCVSASWSNKNFDEIRARYTRCHLHITCEGEDLRPFSELLINSRDVLLRLLENPNLLEHESFTELLWAVFHLADELSHRQSLADLPRSDLEHLANDVKRAYELLIIEWIEYMKHLKNEYPYLFSLAVRTSPFNPDPRPEVT